MTQRTPDARDGALRRLRGVTVGVAGTALGAVAVFAALAAATIPGHSTTATPASITSASTSSASPSSRTGTSTDTSGLQTTTAPQTSSSSSTAHAATAAS